LLAVWRGIAPLLVATLGIAACGGAAPVPSMHALPSGTAHIYWTNDCAGCTTIGGANLDGSGVVAAVIGGIPRPCGIAVAGGYLYWGSENGSAIGRAKLDGSSVEPAFITTGTHGVCSIATDATYLYWANFSHDAGTSIGRAKLDGGEVKDPFITTSTGPTGVAVDAGHVYWTTYHGGTIGRAALDGSAVETAFVSDPSLAEVSGIATDGTYLYWTTEQGGTVGRARTDGTDVEPAFVTGDRGTCGPAVDGSYVYWGNYGTAANPNGVEIGRANLDGSGIDQSFIIGASGACGIAFDH
jgi:hypothetical protein